MEPKEKIVTALTDEEDECLFYFRQLSHNGKRCVLWQLPVFLNYERKQNERKPKTKKTQNVIYPELKIWKGKGAAPFNAESKPKTGGENVIKTTF